MIALTVHDIETLTRSFWDVHTDHAMAMDTGAGTLVAIQLNLVAGTLVKYLKESSYVQSLMDDVLSFNVLAHYCLTEVGHGLDAINIETTGTLLADGSFELHTPHPGAAKSVLFMGFFCNIESEVGIYRIMPPTSPCGIPAIGIVFAKLIVKGKDFGIRPFLLPLNDGKVMMPGITARLLPPREGPPPLNHSITSFNPLALAGSCITTMDRSAYIAGPYSQRRTVGLPDKSRVPILTFRTQHKPILTTLAQAFVAKELFRVAIEDFAQEGTDLRVRQAWATIVKATLVEHSKTATLLLAERCGAQGLFAYNEMCSMHSSLLGLSTAEGDVLGTCIRLVSELLQERCHVPLSTHPTDLLALHEQGLLAENRAILAQISGHRSADFNNLVLPKSEHIVRAIGHRMAYDAAVDAGLDPKITELYLATAVKFDSAWYSENVELPRHVQDARENEAICAALPCLDEWLVRTGVECYSQVPILSENNWASFVEGLEEFGSDLEEC
ncbi:hypothetical protein B0H14DRAFT_3107587 [Mycena olivaceomarginata]|nr:hypothetical protein B0H14DRAFT_3107587 [Mycena olivaceomarginata]